MNDSSPHTVPAGSEPISMRGVTTRTHPDRGVMSYSKPARCCVQTLGSGQSDEERRELTGKCRRQVLAV